MTKVHEVQWRQRRPCRVFRTVQFWMEQPLDMVEKAASEW